MALHCMQFHAGEAVMKEITCSMHTMYVEHDVALNRKIFTKILFSFFRKIAWRHTCKSNDFTQQKKQLLTFSKNIDNLGRKWY
jgi:hypothetical protein